jgi:hypothetical protein
MPALKGGSVADFSNSLGEAIERALEQELMALKGQILPADTASERRMLLAAIGRGVLDYLKAHQNELLITVSLDSGSGPVTFTVQSVDLNYP